MPTDRRLRVAAIQFLNPAPLMWDFEHPPLQEDLSTRYALDFMLPSQCADRLATGAADLGLVPIAALATTPGLQIVPGCTIASKGKVRSLLLVRRRAKTGTTPDSQRGGGHSQPHDRGVRAFSFTSGGNADVQFAPRLADLDAMLERADAAIVIGDPALLALEERANRFERTGEELVFHDLAEEWRALTGLPFVSAIWGAAHGVATRVGRILEERVAPGLN